MEPTANPNLNPVPPTNPEGVMLPEVNAPVAGSPEFQPPASQGAPVSPPPSTQQAPPALQPVAPGAPASAPAQPASGLTTPPSAADDVDVIEKEWVEQAEQVIERTKDDPFTEEEAVEELQADYLKKRYGHDLKRSNDG